MLDAIAKAARLPAADVRKAAMLAGSVRAVASAGADRRRRRSRPFRRGALFAGAAHARQPAADVADALRQLGGALFEWKIDGARVQVHKRRSEVRVYTRNLREVSASVPEIVEQVGTLSAVEVILDGEAMS